MWSIKSPSAPPQLLSMNIMFSPFFSAINFSSEQFTSCCPIFIYTFKSKYLYSNITDDDDVIDGFSDDVYTVAVQARLNFFRKLTGTIKGRVCACAAAINCVRARSAAAISAAAVYFKL